MKTIACCFVALLATTFAVPMLVEDDSTNNDDRIIGGTETTVQAHPHIFSMRYYSFHRCAGSILSNKVGLTAAICLTPFIHAENFHIKVGTTTRKGDANHQDRVLTRFKLHPRFAPAYDQYNIALVFWEKPLILGSLVRPIALPPQGSAVPFGKAATVTGWGKTTEQDPNYPDVLNAVTISVIDTDVCNGTTIYNGQIFEDMFCAGPLNGGTGACEGDCGDPLVINNVLFGISHENEFCSRPMRPSVFTRVPSYTKWVRENM